MAKKKKVETPEIVQPGPSKHPRAVLWKPKGGGAPKERHQYDVGCDGKDCDVILGSLTFDNPVPGYDPKERGLYCDKCTPASKRGRDLEAIKETVKEILKEDV